ncbi:unnamed protein product [Symbiodinium sp. CCMP2456]|nr:unnamed protein product [Symbiodinium sp. CCMP2456]
MPWISTTSSLRSSSPAPDDDEIERVTQDGPVCSDGSVYLYLFAICDCHLCQAWLWSSTSEPGEVQKEMPPAASGRSLRKKLQMLSCNQIVKPVNVAACSPRNC